MWSSCTRTRRETENQEQEEKEIYVVESTRLVTVTVSCIIFDEPVVQSSDCLFSVEFWKWLLLVAAVVLR